MGKYSFGKDGPEFNDVAIYPAYASVTTAATPASGSVAVQFVFKDVNGNAVTSPVAGTFYVSEVATGLTHSSAATGLAIATNGAITHLVTNDVILFTTTAAGLLGVTITAAAADYYVVFVKPDGSLLISDVCTVS